MPISLTPVVVGRFVALLTAAAWLSACEAGALVSEQLVGCYSDQASGSAILKISKDSGQFHGKALMSPNVWSAAAFRRATPGELSELFGRDISAIADGLISTDRVLGIFRARSGAVIRQKDPRSDFLLFFLAGTGPAYKVACQ